MAHTETLLFIFPRTKLSSAQTVNMQELRRDNKPFHNDVFNKVRRGRQSGDANVRCARLIGKVLAGCATARRRMRILFTSHVTQNISTYFRVQIHSTASNLLIKSQTIIARGYTLNVKLQLSWHENTLLYTNRTAV